MGRPAKLARPAGQAAGSANVLRPTNALPATKKVNEWPSSRAPIACAGSGTVTPLATTGTCGSGNAPSGSPPTTRPGGPLPLREQAGFVITCNERSNAGTVERLRAVKPTNPAHPKT